MSRAPRAVSEAASSAGATARAPQEASQVVSAAASSGTPVLLALQSAWRRPAVPSRPRPVAPKATSWQAVAGPTAHRRRERREAARAVVSLAFVSSSKVTAAVAFEGEVPVVPVGFDPIGVAALAAPVADVSASSSPSILSAAAASAAHFDAPFASAFSVFAPVGGAAPDGLFAVGFCSAFTRFFSSEICALCFTARRCRRDALQRGIGPFQVLLWGTLFSFVLSRRGGVRSVRRVSARSHSPVRLGTRRPLARPMLMSNVSLLPSHYFFSRCGRQ